MTSFILDPLAEVCLTEHSMAPARPRFVDSCSDKRLNRVDERGDQAAIDLCAALLVSAAASCAILPVFPLISTVSPITAFSSPTVHTRRRELRTRELRSDSESWRLSHPPRVTTRFVRSRVYACVRSALRAKCRLSPWSGRWVRAGSTSRVEIVGCNEREEGRERREGWESDGDESRPAGRAGGRRGKRPLYEAHLGRSRQHSTYLGNSRRRDRRNDRGVRRWDLGLPVNTSAGLSRVDSESVSSTSWTVRKLCQSAKGSSLGIALKDLIIT